MSWQRQSRDDSLLARTLGLLTRGLLRAPRAVLAVGTLLAVAALLTTFFGLGFRTDRLDLLNPKSTYNQRWLTYLDEFGHDDDAVLVFEGIQRDVVVDAIDAMATELAKNENLFHSVVSRIDAGSLREKGLHYLSPDQLNRIHESVSSLGRLLNGDWNQLELSSMLNDWNRQVSFLLQSPSTPLRDQRLTQAKTRLVQLMTGLAQSLASQSPGGQKPSGHNSKSTSWIPHLFDDSDHPLNRLDGEAGGYLLSDNGRLGLLLVRLKAATGNKLAQGSDTIAELRRIISDQSAANPQVTIGLTGLPILENDEMQTSQDDMTIAGLVSLAGVACLFIAGFGGVRLPLMTLVCLLLAMAWSFGYVTIGIGHLNILSISFGVILIGLGIDFGIHYVARYTQLRSGGIDCEEALVQTASSVGAGILTGGVTTALAFFSAVLTEFTGVAELGLVAGGGILLCIVASLTVLPALIRLSERTDAEWREPRPLPFSIVCLPAVLTPSIWILVSTVATIILGMGITRLTFDHNLLHLQAENLESVAWEHRLLASGDHSVWFALSISDSAEELLRKKQRFEQLESVRRTEEIVSLTPATNDSRTNVIRSIQEPLNKLPLNPPLLPIVPQRILLEQLNRTLSVVASGGRGFETAQTAVERVYRSLQQGDWNVCSRQVSQFQQQLAKSVLDQLHQLDGSANPLAPTLNDLPPALVKRFVGRNGKHLLRIYAGGDIWDMDALTQFVREVESVDPNVTGHPIQTFYSSRQMQQSYIQAAVYSLLAVAIVLMLDFRSVRLVLLAMLPMACGMIQLFGLLGWMGIPLNPANLIVLPLILGIGIDDGVHIVHDFLRRGPRYRVSQSTAAAVVLTSATTMVGFGSMMLARHQGLRSLGQVLTLGVSCCLVMTLVTLPAALAFISRRTKSHGEPLGRESPSVSGLSSPRRSHRSTPAADVDSRG